MGRLFQSLIVTGKNNCHIGIKEALNTITPTVSLMTDYYVLTDREIKHLKVWNHNTSLPPSFFLTFVFIEMLAATYGVSWLCMSKRGVCTDIDSIYHSVTDKFVTGLQISFFLTYMESHDSWKEVQHEYYMLFSSQTGYIMWHSRLMIYIPWGACRREYRA